MKSTYLDAAVLAALEALESSLPGLVEKFGQSADFWQRVCQQVSEIEDLAGADGWIDVNRQVDWMLERLRVDPSGWSGFFNV